MGEWTRSSRVARSSSTPNSGRASRRSRATADRPPRGTTPPRAGPRLPVGDRRRARTGAAARRAGGAGTSGARTAPASLPTHRTSDDNSASLIAEHPLLVGQPHELRRPTASTPTTMPMPTTTSAWPSGLVGGAAVADRQPASAMPSGTISTNRRANRTPACLARRPCGPGRRGPGPRPAPSSRRSRSVPPSSWAISSVSQVASAVGSASCALSTARVRAKSVEMQPLAWAAAKAGRSSTGPRAPTSNRAWGIDRPSATVRMRISSIIRGHASCAVARRLRSAGAADEATGKDAANVPSDERRERCRRTARSPAAAPTTNSAAMTADELGPAARRRGPACTSHSLAAR